jgi:quercetin dioxygenase-like cupin family protein
MSFVRNADVPAVMEHNDTVASHFMVPFDTLRDVSHGSYLEFVNEFLVAPNTFIEPHYHNSLEFYYVLTGHATMRVGDEVAEVTPGDLIYTPPNVPHSIYAHQSGVRCLSFATALYQPGEATHTPVVFEDWPPAMAED